MSGNITLWKSGIAILFSPYVQRQGSLANGPRSGILVQCSPLLAAVWSSKLNSLPKAILIFSAIDEHKDKDPFLFFALQLNSKASSSIDSIGCSPSEIARGQRTHDIGFISRRGIFNLEDTVCKEQQIVLLSKYAKTQSPSSLVSIQYKSGPSC